MGVIIFLTFYSCLFSLKRQFRRYYQRKRIDSVNDRQLLKVWKTEVLLLLNFAGTPSNYYALLTRHMSLTREIVQLQIARVGCYCFLL